MKMALAINKGGGGKTTSCCAIGQVLALAGYKVLEVDTDPQANTSRVFGILEDIEGLNYEALYCSRLEEHEMRMFVQKTNFEGIDIIPSAKQMKRMHETIYDAKKENAASVLCFKKNLELIEPDYDFILIDSSPSINGTLDCCVAASDKVLIPINPDNFSFEGIAEIIEMVEELNDRYNLSIKFGGIFMTRIDKRTNLFRGLSANYKKVFKDYFLPVSIRDCIAVTEANTLFVPLFKYKMKCNPTVDYVELVGHLNIMDNKHYNKLLKMVKK